jgi:predicted alpha/beta-fold hydrolase
MRAHQYRPAWWLPGAHLRTIWGKLSRRPFSAATRMERWDTPDGDFLDLQRLEAPSGRPRLVVLHGLEGSPRSHYARGLASEASRRGWAADVIVFRSCGGEPNRALRSYHSGETTDLDFVVRRLVDAAPDRPLVFAGVSLGGNVLLKWLGERGGELPPQVVAAAAVSVPYDLARGARRIDRGFSRVYQALFLRTLRRKAREKCERFPDCLRPEAIDRARSLYEFDDAVTAPVHGFRDAEDYYTQSSSIRFLARIRTPTLLLSAADDPFLPATVLDEVREIVRDNPALHAEFVERGGHVGFISGTVPWRPFYYAEWRATEFLEHQLAVRLAARVEGEPIGR